MFITITGELGSGKTTIAKLLEKEYGFTIHSTGTIQREIAKEKGISTLELNQQMTNDLDNIYDKMIDEKTVELSRTQIGKNIVFDSRMAWHFVEQSFKVYVTVDAYVAANRVILADRGTEEQYSSIKEAAKSLMKRKQLEDSRFAQMYLVKTTDFSNYDLIVDSSSISPEELAKFVFSKATAQNATREIFLSPQRLFPTKKAQEISTDYVAALKDTQTLAPVEVIMHEGFYYILDGHHRVCSQIQKGEKLIPVTLLEADDKTPKERIQLSKSDYSDWEALNAITFFDYPD